MVNNYTPIQKLVHGIARVQLVKGLAEEASWAAPPPYAETMGQIRDLAVEALLILNSLRGQVGGPT